MFCISSEGRSGLITRRCRSSNINVPNTPHCSSEKGRGTDESRDWKEAEAELRRILDRRDEHVMALVHLGTCLIAMDKAEQAERPLNSALRVDPNNSDAWYQRGLLYLDFGRGEEALSDFESASRNDSKHIDAKLMIAAILHERGDTKEAINAWRKVLDIDPQHRLARRRLEEVRENFGHIPQVLQIGGLNHFSRAVAWAESIGPETTLQNSNSQTPMRALGSHMFSCLKCWKGDSGGVVRSPATTVHMS